MDKIVNLTPHAISVYASTDTVENVQGRFKTLVLKEGAQPIAVFPSEGVARASATKNEVGQLEIAGLAVAIEATTYGEVENLPQPQEGTYYVVSALTAQAAKGRTDLLVVGTTVRNAEGQIVGCISFGKI